MKPTPTDAGSPAWRHAKLALAWAAFVAYGSLVPLEYKPHPDAWQAFLHTPWLQLGVGSRADWVANILLYLALAYFATGAVLTSRIPAAIRLVLLGLVLSACLAMAVGIEYLQLFFPPRTVSRNDLLAEGIGTALGALFWFISGRRIARMWERFVAGGAQSMRALLALYAIGYLAISFFPYDFLVSTAELGAKLAKPGSVSLGPGLTCGKPFTCGVKLVAETVLVIPVGVLLVLVTRSGRRAARRIGTAGGFVAGAAIGLLVEAVQILLASGATQGISILTRGLGTAWGVALASSPAGHWLRYSPASLRRATFIALPFYLALVLALNDVLPLQLQPLWAATEKLADLRFLPFYYHYYTSETAALRSLLFVAGSYAPIGLIAALAWPAQHRRTAWPGAFVAAALCLGVEILKLFSVGKRPDPTNLLIAAASALFLHWVASRIAPRPREASSHDAAPVPVASASVFARHRFLLGVIAPVVTLLLVVAVSVPSAPQSLTNDAPALTFPPPEALAPANLPGFHTAHPRLPHPLPGDVALLEAFNPNYVNQLFSAARNNPNAINVAIIAARMHPGSIDLAPTHQRLMALSFWERGDGQVKPLALAYDWLYDQWSPPQRAALGDKLAEGCAYVMEVIRKEQLSPYNVFLYNSPLQALMACSIALYRDHPRGEAFMTFTQELWKNRVLPVWRQIFGRNGGWHEGGEYVAIGIGQAIYTLPAMWRAATGEDLFKSEPGIRGFLDFLVYRNRPDGTQFRWGDGSNFTRPSPDAIPLALAYRHAAAYSLTPPQGPPIPTGWPWGPLSDRTLIDPLAAARLPLARLFDGIGMLVARSDWSPEATYLSFKAGDNFWSHSHLDQGAFTIYKGGELAIDSGVYGPAYGSDHHMNYAYQSIAHNLVTVTDPADIQPGPGFEAEPRPYANDGGQRRIGSGWGVEAAPLDRDEWEKRRDTYHTGRIVRHLEQDGLAVAVADLTPAYTNGQSGRGTFPHRTKRVERMWRVFGYDHINDAVIVFDDVVATDPAFRKRWLLHTIEQPAIKPDGFTVTVSPATGIGHSGGRLEGRVLLPANPVLNTIGGPGFEFFVDGMNYDEGGKLRETIRRLRAGQAEPGAWRIELMPPRDSGEDQFLVVMFPTLAGQAPRATVRRLDDKGRVGAEITSPQRTTRWWYQPGKLGVQVDIIENGHTRAHALLAP